MIVQPQDDHPLVEAATLTADQLALVREIYDEAFPEDLRVPFDDLLVDRVLVRLDADGPARGARGGARPRRAPAGRSCATTPWARAAAAPARRCSTQLAARWPREGGSLLVWDVEDPDEPGLSPEHVDEHQRRIRFYERNGGELLPVAEYRPPHDGGLAGHAPPMRLMCRTLGAWVRPPVADIVRGAYQHRYGAGRRRPRRTPHAGGQRAGLTPSTARTRDLAAIRSTCRRSFWHR